MMKFLYIFIILNLLIFIMSPKKIIRKKMGIKNIKSIVPENLNKIKVNPFNVIDNAKDKINNFYTNLKKLSIFQL